MVTLEIPPRVPPVSSTNDSHLGMAGGAGTPPCGWIVAHSAPLLWGEVGMCSERETKTCSNHQLERQLERTPLVVCLMHLFVNNGFNIYLHIHVVLLLFSLLLLFSIIIIITIYFYYYYYLYRLVVVDG